MALGARCRRLLYHALYSTDSARGKLASHTTPPVLELILPVWASRWLFLCSGLPGMTARQAVDPQLPK